MKIGILTCPLASNIGGILQNYALQKVLVGMNHQPITIDYGARYPIYRWFLGRICSFITRKNTRVPFPWNNRIGTRRYQNFIKKHIKKTVYYKSITQKTVSNYSFDALIVGSDQVWRKDYNDNIYNMFLDFAETFNIIKISYAASVGTTKWEYTKEQTDRCRELVSKFNAVSVREQDSVVLCKEQLGVNAIRVLDPTLLLGKDVYLELCSELPVREKLLFAYILDINDEKINIINEIARRKNLSVYIKSSEINLSEKDSIEEWLSFYRDASFVVTDSYHGTLFSIVFNKEFITIPNMKRGFSRFSSILGILCLEDRLFKEDIGVINNVIDWRKTNVLLEKEKEKSLSFLKTYLVG